MRENYAVIQYNVQETFLSMCKFLSMCIEETVHLQETSINTCPVNT